MGLSIVRDVFYRVSDCTKRWHKERRERCGVKCKKKVVGGRRATKVVTKHTHSHTRTQTPFLQQPKKCSGSNCSIYDEQITFHFFKGMNRMKRRAGQGTLGSSLVEVGKRAILLGLAWTGDIFTFILSFLPVPIQRGRGGRISYQKTTIVPLGLEWCHENERLCSIPWELEYRTGHSQFSSLFFFSPSFLLSFAMRGDTHLQNE